VHRLLAEVANLGSTDRGGLSTVGGDESQPPPAGAGQTWFGRFVIEARLGVGGMGEVFRARDGARPIALKLMRPELAADPRHRLMFVTEAQLAAQLRHRNLVRLHDFGNTNGLLWMALDLVEGLPLDRLLTAGALPAAVAGHVALELLDALAYVHAHAMVHRDVSAANVLVSTEGAIKLSDFGVAKLSTKSMTRTNEEKGKPSYMAPEQLREHAPLGPIDGRVDLFAVGVLLHRMTQGEPPFTDVGAWLRAGAPRTATGPLAQVIARAMQPDRRARFADARAMAAAILRDLPSAAATGLDDAMAARVRDCAAVATPMEDFDRLIIAALGAGPAGGGARTSPPANSAGNWLQPLVPSAATKIDAFSDQMSTTRRSAEDFGEQLPTLSREPTGDDAFGEETTTQAVQFDRQPTRVREPSGGGARIRPGDSISEAICTSPVAVDVAVAAVENALTSLPLAVAAAPMVMMPAPLKRWWLWLIGGVAIVTVLGLALTLRHSRRPPLSAAVVVSSRAALPAAAPAPARPTTAAATTTTRPAHHRGTRTAKLALRSTR
jgi:serine/threonine protein kinase